MNVEQLYDLYTNNIQSILTSSMLGTIADRSYDIHGYNLINRLLIYIQNKYTTSLKSETGWEIAGRSVKIKASPIWVMDNVIKTEYLDPETNDVIENMGLSPKEIDEAVKYGTIIKLKTIEGLKCLPVYNIKDTVIFDSMQYKRFMRNERKLIKLSSLFSITSAEFGVEYQKGLGKSYFDIAKNHIFIGNDGFQDKIKAMSDGVFHSLGLYDVVDDFVEEHSIDRDRLYRILEICRIFLRESLLSFCDPEYTVESSTFKDIDDLDISESAEVECFIQLLSSIYDIVEECICRLNPDNHNISESTLRKAAELLAILEANDAIMQFRR